MTGLPFRMNTLPRCGIDVLDEATARKLLAYALPDIGAAVSVVFLDADGTGRAIAVITDTDDAVEVLDLLAPSACDGGCARLAALASGSDTLTWRDL